MSELGEFIFQLKFQNFNDDDFHYHVISIIFGAIYLNLNPLHLNSFDFHPIIRRVDDSRSTSKSDYNHGDNGYESKPSSLKEIISWPQYDERSQKYLSISNHHKIS